MKKLTFTNALLSIFTISLILYWLYAKIFRRTLKIELSSQNIEKYYDYLFYIVYFSIYMLLFSTFIIVISLYLKNKKVNETSFSKKIFRKLTIFLDYINIFYRTYVILFAVTSAEYTQYLLKLAKFILDFKRITSFIIIVSFISLPRFIIIITLFIEIYLGQLHYYFYTLLLLLIPLLFRIILFMLKDVGSRVLPELKQIVKQGDIKENPAFPFQTKDGIKNCVAIRFYLVPEYADLDLDYVMYDFYYPALFIGPHIEENINPRVDLISKITVITYYILTAFGFSYILLI